MRLHQKILLGPVLLLGFIMPLQAQITKSADWVVIDQKKLNLVTITPPAAFNFNISLAVRQPGLSYRQQLAKRHGVDAIKEWADYWDQRLETSIYLQAANKAGGLLLVVDDTTVVYPFGATGNTVVATAKSIPINRMYDHTYNRAVWELCRWEVEQHGDVLFSLKNNIHGYLECSPQIKLNKNKTTGQLFRWVIIPLKNASAISHPRMKTRNENMIIEENVFFRNKPNNRYVLGLYNISQKVFVGLSLSQGKYEWATLSPAEFMAGKFVLHSRFYWDFLYPAAVDKKWHSVTRRNMATAEWDMDGDGVTDIDCGGSDCDDTDARRYPGAPEVCDPAGLDEDCNPSTFGDRDVDGDGYTDAACCNMQDDGTIRCGTDCDDSKTFVNPGSGLYLYVNDSTVQEASCRGYIYRLPPNQVAIAMPNGTAHVSYRNSPAAILSKEQKQ